VDRLIPTKIGSSTWSRVSAGRGYVLGIQTDGTLWAWGRDDNNQLGDYYAAWGSITYLAAFNNVPVQLSPVMISAAGDWQEVQAGMVATSSAIKGGALWQWGYNTDMFQVGAATNWVTVNSAGGGAFYSAINSLGELWQWTLTTPPPNYTLVASAETQFDAPNHYLSVSAYNGSVLLVRADHTLWAFGLNYAGQLGLGYASSSFLTPVPFQQVGVATDWTAVSIYGPTSFGIRGATNDLYSWGFNNLGLLGDGTLVNKTSPVLVGTGYQSIPQGNTESVALKTDGTIWECGQNTQGEFGRGVLDAALVTTRVQAP
jgi:alpha-tubulin suppressor-like RCC1 family protein